MKISKKYIRDLIRVALREAEEEKAADEGGEEGANPFAGSEEGGGEEGGGEEGGGEEGGGEDPAAEKEGDKEGGGEGPKPEDLTINFNISKVKRYNNGKFAGNTGVVKKVTKDGLVVTTQPDNVDIVVNFEDITESAKKFFKNRR
jgi:hypothetical protein